MKIRDWCPPKSALSFHSEQALKDLGLNWDYQAAIQDDQLTQDDQLFHKWPLLRSHELLSQFPARPEKVQLIECVDCLYSKDGVQWPDLVLPSALRAAIRSRIQTLDLRMSAYVIGADILVRPLVSMSVNLGFSNIVLVSHDEAFLKSEKKFLERRLMGVKIETVLTSDLTLQPQNAGLVLNSINLNERKDSLQDIAYFNFMISKGVFVDLFEDGAHKTLQDEADRAQLICIKPFDVEKAWWNEVRSRLGLDQGLKGT